LLHLFAVLGKLVKLFCVLFFASRQTGKFILFGGAHAQLSVFSNEKNPKKAILWLFFSLLLLCKLSLHNGF